MIDKLKSKVTNPYLKDNFTIENISNFFANFIAGNQFINNLEVKELAEFNKLEVKDSFKSKGEAHFENLNVNKLASKALTINDNEIIFDPEAALKMRDTNIEFKVKDIFEVITFMKYIVKICGSKLEKCDFDTLLKNHNANQLMQILNKLNKKQEEIQQEKAKKEQEEKTKQEEVDKKVKNDQQLQEKANSDTNNGYKFKQSDNELFNAESSSFMKGINDPITSMNDDYSKMMSTPGINEMFNNYYYQMPYYNNANLYLK
jgi:hypothetical protein